MERKWKPGMPCPNDECRDRLQGTLVLHCAAIKAYDNRRDVLDDVGGPRGCSWLRCTECGYFGTPGTAGWVHAPAGEQAA